MEATVQRDKLRPWLAAALIACIAYEAWWFLGQPPSTATQPAAAQTENKHALDLAFACLKEAVSRQDFIGTGPAIEIVCNGDSARALFNAAGGAPSIPINGDTAERVNLGNDSFCLRRSTRMAGIVDHLYSCNLRIALDLLLSR
jgi:hypothetical protein